MLNEEQVFTIYRDARESHFAYKIGELISGALVLALGIDMASSLMHRETPSGYEVGIAVVLIIAASIFSKQKQSKYFTMKQYEPYINADHELR